jgi:hypothetical protein
MGLCVGDDGVRLNEAPLFGFHLPACGGGKPSLRFDFGALFFSSLFFWASKRKGTYQILINNTSPIHTTNPIIINTKQPQHRGGDVGVGDGIGHGAVLRDSGRKQ